MKEISWRHKSQVLWLKEGDKNSQFFHQLANSHRRTNIIGQLSINGVMSIDQDVIREHIAQYYEHLFSESESKRPLLNGLQFSSIFATDVEILDKPFEEAEIFNVCQEF